MSSVEVVWYCLGSVGADVMDCVCIEATVALCGVVRHSHSECGNPVFNLFLFSA